MCVGVGEEANCLGGAIVVGGGVGVGEPIADVATGGVQTWFAAWLARLEAAETNGLNAA